VRPLGTGSGLLIGQVRRHGGQRTVFGHRQVLGMGTEPAPVLQSAVAEHPVADRQGRDATADRLDLAGKLIAQDRHLRPDQPGEQPHDEGLARPEAGVRPVHRGRMNLDQHLVAGGRRLVHLGDPHHLRRTVAGVYGCPHG
jgi:hypothetical protein